VVRRNIEGGRHARSRTCTRWRSPPRAPARRHDPARPRTRPEFVRDVTAKMLAGEGDDLPVSALPVDGTYPSGTSRGRSATSPRSSRSGTRTLCIQCGNCAFVCPHAVMRAKATRVGALDGAPAGSGRRRSRPAGFPDTRYTLQVYEEDCTGCGCAWRSARRRPVGERPEGHQPGDKGDDPAPEREHTAFFETAPHRARVDFSNVRGVQFLEPLFEFSGRLRRLRRDALPEAHHPALRRPHAGGQRHRLLVDLRRQPADTPWAKNADGRGPAWSNSLFEDNAEFGLGSASPPITSAAAGRALVRAAPELGGEFADAILDAPQQTKRRSARSERAPPAPTAPNSSTRPAARQLCAGGRPPVRRRVWIVGGDGWAYDIGSAASTTCSPPGATSICSCSTPRSTPTPAARCRSPRRWAPSPSSPRAASHREEGPRQQAIAYGNVYVARVAMGANPQQTLQALREAEAYPGPSLILAYSHCIAHGYRHGAGPATSRSGGRLRHWPLIRYNPALRGVGENPFTLDSLRGRRGGRARAEHLLRPR
jgi:pyruvate-ferredoxin/flavodoxin oxidoreductase